MKRMQIISVAYIRLSPILNDDELIDVIEELEYSSYEQHGDDTHLTDLEGEILPALVENGLITQEESDEITNGSVSHLIFEG